MEDCKEDKREKIEECKEDENEEIEERKNEDVPDDHSNELFKDLVARFEQTETMLKRI